MKWLVPASPVRLFVALSTAIVGACGSNAASPSEDVSPLDGAVGSVPVDGSAVESPDAGRDPLGGPAGEGSAERDAASAAADANAGGEAGASGSDPDAGGSQDAGQGARADGGSAPGTIDAGAGSGCSLPPTVSFQKDVQPFLITSCSGTGCHVIDAASTMASGGYNHAYDWITAGAHASSCPETPTPLRFQVVMAVISEANPPSCSKSDKMPPPSAGASWAPLTVCQAATLQAWLDEPLVTQMHRADDSSPTTPYPMPPFN